MSRLTDDQVRAADPAASVWVSASAGTGKTHVLSARVLRMLLSGAPADRIVCLTFTKAAAAEMATRVYRELGRWVRMDDVALAERLHARTGAAADGPMLARARRLFAQVLDLPGGLQIQTIHAFCQSLLGRFPLEAGLPPQFTVIDEAQSSERLRAARDALLARARGPGEGVPRAALAHVATRVTEAGFDDVMTGLIGERAALERALVHHGSEDGLIAATRRALGVTPEDTETTVLAAALADTALDRPGLESLAEALATGTGAREPGHAAAIAALLAAAPADRPGCYDRYRTVFLTKPTSSKPRPAPRATVATQATLAKHPHAADVIAAEQARLHTLEEHLAAVRTAENTAAIVRLGARLAGLYQADKVQLGVLDYDDLILSTDKLLDQAGIAPWILYKLDGGIDHMLLDEAQDTNPEQWRVVETLSAEFFAGQGARPLTRTVFAVGDAKQSIYSFQRADPAEFARARARTAQRAHGGAHDFRAVELTLSFRSTAAVLDLVDAVFADPALRDGLTDDAGAIAHEAARAGHAGLVELWPTEPPATAPAAEDWAPPVDQQAADSAEARLARRIAGHVQAMVDGGERLASKDRPVRPGDIMVLVRRRTAFVDELVAALKATGVPVAGIDRMTLTDQLAVLDLMALGRFAIQPDDDLTLATVLKSPLIGLTEEALFDLAHDRAEPRLWRELARRRADSPALADAHRYLADRLAEADFVTPFEFFSAVLSAHGGRRRLVARLGGDISDPLDEFLARVTEYERSHPPSLEGFLHWLDRGQADIKRDLETGTGEVRILTVHGAKGLQAPVVFLPDTCGRPTKRSALLTLAATGLDGQADPDLLLWPGGARNEVAAAAQARRRQDGVLDAEYRRLLYVALTRAEDRLYVCGWDSRNKRSPHCWYDQIAAAFDRLDGADTVETADGRSVRRYATAQTAPPERQEQPAARPREAAALPAWTCTPAPAEPALPRPLTPSRLEGDEPAGVGPLARASDARFARARLIHRLLELLPDVPADLRPAAAERLVRAEQPDIGPADIAALWREVAAVLDHADFAPLFGPASQAEAAIAGIVGARAIAGRVDRLVVTDHAVLVIDYKTNRPAPARAEDVPAIYLKQMAAYAAALAGIYPDRTVRCALLWTDGPRLMPLAPAVLAAHAP